MSIKQKLDNNLFQIIFAYQRLFNTSFRFSFLKNQFESFCFYYCYILFPREMFSLDKDYFYKNFLERKTFSS